MQVIDRNTLTNKAETLYQHTPSGKIIPWSAVRVCAINNIKTIDAEPVRRGHWIERDGIFKDGVIKVDHLECSECGKTQRRYRDTPYCPNCGAKMD